MQDETLGEQVKKTVKKFWDETVLGNTSDVGTTAAPVKTADDLTQLQGLHSIFKYEQYDAETGLFYNDNSISFMYEVQPQTGADEDMARRLTTLFSPIPPDTGLQWCLFGTSNLDDEFEEYMAERHVAVDNGKAMPFFVDLAKSRVKHVYDHKGTPLWPDANFFIKNIRLVFSVTKEGSYKDEKLKQEMFELRETLRSSLRSAGLPSIECDAEHLINFLWPALNPECMFGKQTIQKAKYDDSRPIKDQLTGFGQQVRVKPNELLFGLPPEKKGDPDDRIAMRALGVLQYPKVIQLWQMANIIGNFFDDGLQYPCPFMVCGGIYTLDAGASDSKAQLKAARTMHNANSKMAAYQPELKMQAEDWRIVQHQLSNGGSLCELYHTVLLFSPKKTINRVTQTAINIWRNERFTIASLQLLQLPALYMSMPMTLTTTARNDLKKLRLITTKTTTNAVDMSPVIAEWRGAGRPVMMFFGRRGTPTFLDFYSNKQGNYNLFVTGVSGAGKSVVMNEVVSAYRSIGARAWVIDVGRSYKNLVGMQNGAFIEFTPETKMCINPFTWIGTDSDLDFKAEIRILKPMIGRMASPNAPLTEFQYALIQKALTDVWADYGNDTDPTKIQAYLKEKIKDERGNVERQAYELAFQLQPFTKDGQFGHFFNGKANIDIDASEMVGLELEELKNAPELRRVVLFVLTSRIAHSMYLSRDQPKICLIDEAWQLLGSDPETADFIEEGYRRARKYNGIFAVGTQGIEDAFKNDASKAAYTNADWKLFLRQDPKSLESTISKGLVDFSPAIKRQLLSLRTEAGRYSEMLISSPNGDSVVRHIADPLSLVMASTNAADYIECQTLLASGHSTVEAMRIMVQRRTAEPPENIEYQSLLAAGHSPLEVVKIMVERRVPEALFQSRR